MKQFWKTFVHRGLCAAAGGPAIMAIVYLCLHAAGAVESIDAGKVAVEILTATLLALAIGIFTGIFIVGFAVIWYIILLVNRHKVAEMNRKMQKS